MRYRRTLLASGLLVATLACACVEHAPGDSSRTDSTSSPIEGGEPINKAGYPTSTQFPQSTVLLTTPFQAPTGLRNRFCTGVILTPTKILTAAHCLVGPTTVVSFYP